MPEQRKGPIITREEKITKTIYLIEEGREVVGPTIIKTEKKNHETAYHIIADGDRILLSENRLRELKQLLEKACPGKIITPATIQ